jgi:Xaa-Pro aminopeptidase
MDHVSRLLERMLAADLPALLISHIGNVQWLTGFTGSFGLVVLTPSQGIFITDSRYTIQAQEQIQGLTIRSFANPTTSAEALLGALKEAGVSRIGFEKSMTYANWEDWTQKLTGIELIPTADLISPLRMVKTPEELERLREACKLADATMEHALRMIQPGVREYDIGLDVEFFIRRNGAAIAFEPIVVSGPNSARPHGRPGERRLQAGDFVTLDLGAKLDGYNSDITRTVVVGKASDRQREIYNRVLEAQLAAIAALRPGANGREVDALARRKLGDLAAHFGHGLGHGLGRDVHDAGGLSPTRDQPIEAGQVWTVEPGVYIEGFGGVRIEDDVIVTDESPEVITHTPKVLLEL